MTPSTDIQHKCAVLSAQGKKVVILSGHPMAPFIGINKFNEETHRYEDETYKRYSGMVFENGQLIHAKAFFMELKGKMDIYGMTTENSIYNQNWISPKLTKAYQACTDIVHGNH